jgi:hypothetical protein
MSAEMTSVSAAPRRPRMLSHSSRKITLLVVPRLIPYLAHTLPAGSKLLLLEIGDRELLEVALHRLGQAASDQRLACARRSGQEQSARSGLVPNLEHISSLQQLVHLLFGKEDLAPSCNLAVQSRELLLRW